jgi:hypothetical protein
MDDKREATKTGHNLNEHGGKAGGRFVFSFAEH